MVARERELYSEKELGKCKYHRNHNRVDNISNSDFLVRLFACIETIPQKGEVRQRFQ